MISIDITKITLFSELVAKNYNDFVNDLRGEFALLLAAKNPAAATIRHRFIDAALRLCDERVLRYKDDLTSATELIVQQALSSSLLPEEIGPFMKRHEKELLVSITESVYLTTLHIANLAKRDVKFGGDQLRRLGFNVMMTVANAGIKNAIKGAVIKNVIAARNYTTPSGKPWSSIGSSKLATRHHLITTFNEITLFVGSKMGDKEFVIKTINLANPYSDRVISLADYNDIRERAFHPNANALIYRKNKSPLTGINE